jgi:(p)ppGpp synthase/HD superfamily hydrolase
MMNLYGKALRFAHNAHQNRHAGGPQKRKYTGEDYIVHPVEVAALVAEYTNDKHMIAAAVLHDVLEDTEVTFAELQAEFGADVANLVQELTNASVGQQGNRKARKRMDLEKLAKVSARAQTIKCADSLSNTVSIAENDPKFAKVYLPEMKALLAVLTKADPYIWAKAKRQLEEKLRTL